MTDEIKKIRPDFTGYSETTDEKLTFFGVLNRFYIYDIEGTKSRVGGISRNWNAESTRKANKNNYEKVIFPRIPNIPLEEMTKEDFDEIVQSIIRAGGRGGRAYSAPRIQAFKRLLKGVTEEAAKQGICEDVLFGSSFTANADKLSAAGALEIRCQICDGRFLSMWAALFIFLGCPLPPCPKNLHVHNGRIVILASVAWIF